MKAGSSGSERVAPAPAAGESTGRPAIPSEGGAFRGPARLAAVRPSGGGIAAGSTGPSTPGHVGERIGQ